MLQRSRREKHESLAESPTRLFFKDSEIQDLCVKEDQGKLTKLILHGTGEMEEKKVK